MKTGRNPGGSGRRLRASDSGFSMAELLIVVSSAMILMGIGVPIVRTVMDQYRVVLAGQAIVNQLQYARMKAVSSNESVQVTFGVANNRLTYQVQTPAGEVLSGPHTLPDGVTWNSADGGTGINLTGGFVTFLPTGEVPATGNGSAGRVKIINPDGIRIDIVVAGGGAVRQTPTYKSSPAPF